VTRCFDVAITDDDQLLSAYGFRWWCSWDMHAFCMDRLTIATSRKSPGVPPTAVTSEIYAQCPRAGHNACLLVTQTKYYGRARTARGSRESRILIGSRCARVCTWVSARATDMVDSYEGSVRVMMGPTATIGHTYIMLASSMIHFQRGILGCELTCLVEQQRSCSWCHTCSLLALEGCCTCRTCWSWEVGLGLEQVHLCASTHTPRKSMS
jgi:hypothetical protein